MSSQFQMPEVQPMTNKQLGKIFEQARNLCSVKGGFLGMGAPQRQVSLITPGRLTAQIPCPKPGSMGKEHVRDIEAILPSKPPKHVVAIAYTELKALMGNSGTMDAASVSRVIPFLGFLMGFSYVGHTVVIFEGHPSATPIGLKGADMVLIDERMAPHLQKNFLDVAYKVMRSPVVNLFTSSGQVRRLVKK